MRDPGIGDGARARLGAGKSDNRGEEETGAGEVPLRGSLYSIGLSTCCPPCSTVRPNLLTLVVGMNTFVESSVSGWTFSLLPCRRSKSDNRFGSCWLGLGWLRSICKRFSNMTLYLSMVMSGRLTLRRGPPLAVVVFGAVAGVLSVRDARVLFCSLRGAAMW